MPKDVILTPEGLEKLKAELEDLTTTKRREVAERIKDAREYGDISENSEYDDAKNEQAMLEARILTLEEKLRSATVVDSKDLKNDVVAVGTSVKIKDDAGKSVTYTIVGSTEANPGENRLSNESPVGKALVGLLAGLEVVVLRVDVRDRSHARIGMRIGVDALLAQAVGLGPALLDELLGAGLAVSRSGLSIGLGHARIISSAR